MQRSSQRETQLHVKANGSPQMGKPRIFSSTAATSACTVQSAITQEINIKSGSSDSHNTKRTASPNTSPFISFHLGEPCSIGALDHILTCGHKVLTMRPESCARSCRRIQSFRDHISTSLRRMDEPFICIPCVTQQIAANHGKKASLFREELEMVARETGRAEPTDWIRDKIAIVEVAWLDQALNEMTSKLREGRMAQSFYIDPAFEGFVEKAMRRVGADAEVKTKIIVQPDVAVANPETMSTDAKEVVPCRSEELGPSTPVASSPAPRPSSRTVSRLPVRRK